MTGTAAPAAHAASPTGATALALDIADGVATVTLARAPVNAIDPAWLARLEEIVAALERDPALRVLRVRSRERAFCAGADLAFLRSRFASAAGRAEIIEFTRHMQAVYARLEALEVVSIAEIGGAALGGGLELALACDLRLAADSARLGLPEARLGLLPAGGGTQRLVRLCGEATARRLILGAEIVDGPSAVALGLAQFGASSAGLDEAGAALAAQVAALPRAALAAGKRCIAAAGSGAHDGYALELTHSAALLALPETHRRVRRFLGQGAHKQT